MKSSDQELRGLAARLAAGLTERNIMLATAESCTGGWIAKICTDLPGSSTWFDRGFVTYSNEAKTDMLGVTSSLLEQAGAVSGEVAVRMAEGALQMSGAHAALAVTGIAGPDGGTEDKPVGTIWFGWSIKKSEAQFGTVSEKHVFSGDRDAIRRKTVGMALRRMLEILESR
jgi:nicotinamide-nucleotide amidase